MFSLNKSFLGIATSLIVAFCGCSEDKLATPATEPSPTPSASENWLANPTVTLTGDRNFAVEQTWIGMSCMAGKCAYGVIRMKYLGSSDRVYVEANAQFKDRNGNVLLTDSSFVRNVDVCYDGSGANTNSFFTSKHNVGYYLVFLDMTKNQITDIASVDLAISGRPFNYSDAVGKLSRLGKPYRVENDSWYQSFVNNGDRAVVCTFTCFVFKDLNSRLFKWDFPSSFQASTKEDKFNVHQKGDLKSLGITPDYMSHSLDFAETCLSWDVRLDVDDALPKFAAAASADQRNALVRATMDKISRNNSKAVF